MKGKAEVVTALKEVLTGELTAINQYFLHSRMAQNWGYERLAETMQAEAIDEMKHAGQLIDRILFLEGSPNLQMLGRLRIGQTVKEQFEADLALEQEAIDRLKKSIELAYDHHDHASRDLFQTILVDEEKHTDWLEAQLGIIKEIGISSYLGEQIYK